VPPPGQQDQKNPFNNVVLRPVQIEANFVARRNLAPSVLPWKVECGIKVFVVNADIDPKMIVTPQPGAAEPKIRRISPPPCGLERSEPVPGPAVVEVFKGGVRVR